MKRFKDLLNEFRNAFGNEGQGSGGDGGDYQKHIHRKIREFMEKTPFTYTTPERHELHFNDSLNAARTISDSAGMHYAGWHHSIPFEGPSDTTEEGRKRTMMTNYFMKSTETHDRVLDALQNHIMNHPNLPKEYAVHVPAVIGEIEEQHTVAPSKIAKVGEYVMHEHRPPSNAIRHPHLKDVAHHLKGIVETLKDNPDQGYFLRREEQM